MPFNDAGQPDFTALFFETFTKMPKPIVYEVRRDANRTHDMHFLSSLIHDARFRKADIVEDGQALTFRLDRDRWELFTPGSKELFSVPSTLTIGPVLSQEWSFKEGVEPDELWIYGIHVTPSIPESDSLVVDVCGDFWRLALTLGEADLQIRLKDAE